MLEARDIPRFVGSTFPGAGDGHSPDVGALVRLRRRQLRLPLEQIARRASCSRSYLSQIENRRVGPPSNALLARLEVALQVDAGVLRRAAQRAGPRRGRGAALLPANHASSDHAPREDRGFDAASSSSSPGHARLTNREREREKESESQTVHGHGEPARPALDLECLNLATADPGWLQPGWLHEGALAFRVRDDRMAPVYHPGDVLLLDPRRPVAAGSDCLARLNFAGPWLLARLYFERAPDGAPTYRLQPVNSAYQATVVPREAIAAMVAVAALVRPLHAS